MSGSTKKQDIESLKSNDTLIDTPVTVNANSIARSFMDRWINRSKGATSKGLQRSSASYFFDTLELRNGLVNIEQLPSTTASTEKPASVASVTVKAKTRSLPVLTPPGSPESASASGSGSVSGAGVGILRNALVFSEPESPPAVTEELCLSNANTTLVNGLVYNDTGKQQISADAKGLVNGLICPK